MMPTTRSGVWILYIWIFILFWKAACLQGAEIKRSKQSQAVRDSLNQPLNRHRRELKEDGTTFHTPDESTDTQKIIKTLQTLHSTVENKVRNKQKGSFEKIVETAKGGLLLRETTDSHPAHSNELKEIIEIPVDYSIAKPKQAGKPKVKPSDTNSKININDQAAEKNIKRNKNDTVLRYKNTQNDTNHDEVPQNKKPQMINDETVTPKPESGSRISSSELGTTSIENKEKSSTDLKPTQTENKGKTSSELKTTPADNRNRSPLESIISPKEKKGKASVDLHVQENSSPTVVEMSKNNGVQSSHPVPKLNKTMNKTTNSPKPSNNTLTFKKRPKLTWNKNNNTLTPVKSQVTEKERQSLVLLQNVTREADEIQKRLKIHKLKLKSYIEALRNITSMKPASVELQQNFTETVREKVKDILNPKRRLQNKPKQEKGHEDGHKPNHFLSKDIEDTLRARVDMNVLKKSEKFWDKKGDDTVEPLYAEAYPGETLDLYHTDLHEEASTVEPYGASLVEVGVSEDYGMETSTELPHEETEEHLNDLHQTKVDEVQVTRDRLKSRTEHEMLLINQMVSGRIHGNVLAPPPERCSVAANMKRYRPPEDEMKEDESTLYRVDLQPEHDKILEGGPMDYLKDYKNPCWLSKITDDKGGLWYDYTESGLTYKRMSFLYEMRLSKESNWRMRCLPYLFLVGVTKSGTTDLYTRLMGHPEIMRPGHKEPMWWNRLTLGMAQSLRKPFRYYLDFFDEAAELIRRKVVMKDDKPYHPSITVDATPANLWDYDCWTDIPGNRGLAEPKYTLAHSIKKLVPNARILMILRQPTDRLYSQYRMKSHMEPSATFHKQVLEALVNFNECLKTRSLRSCAYDYQISKHEFNSPGGVFLRASLYYVFVKDWLEVFPPEQVMVVRTEDYQNNTAETLTDVFKFLGLSDLPKDRLNAIVKQREVNTRIDHTDRSTEPIMPETQQLLDDFFRPYNKQLSKLLHDKKFKWNDVRK